MSKETDRWVTEALRGQPLGHARVLFCEAGLILSPELFRKWVEMGRIYGVAVPVTRAEHMRTALTSRRAAAEFVRRLRLVFDERGLHHGKLFTPDGGPAIVNKLPAMKELRAQWEARQVAPLGGVADSGGVADA